MQRQQAHQQHGNDGKHSTQSYPQQSLGTHHRLQEATARIKAEAGQIERQTQLAQHERCRTGGIANEMKTRAERTHDDTHDDRSTGNAQTYRALHARQRHGNRAQCQTQDQSKEDCCQIRFAECLHSISQELLYVIERLRLAHHRESVAILQTQVVGSQQLDITTRDATDVHTIDVAQLQMSQPLTIEHLTRENQRTALHL